MEVGKKSERGYIPKRTTGIVLHSTLLVCASLALLLVLYELSTDSLLCIRAWGACVALSYVLVAEVFFRYKRLKTVSWMLIAFYQLLAFLTLLQWGLNAPVGLLTTSFVVLLPGVLMGYRFILPVALSTLVMLFTVQIIHAMGIIKPNLSALSVPSTFWDVVTYCTILGVFALVSWLSGSQLERSLRQTQRAEAKLRTQKDVLRVELERESLALRQAELRQVRHLHKFALMGQSTAAILHELSNHLSVLNLDIDNLRQHNSNSKAIADATAGIDAINKMVHQASRQLDSFETTETFNAISTINRSLKDLDRKLSQRQVCLTKIVKGSGSFQLNGGRMALMQIVTILVNNAIDACCNSSKPVVTVSMHYTETTLTVIIEDNGPGIKASTQKNLFKPHISSKPSGLGVGLYIAQQLSENQLNGSLHYEQPARGARFILTIPKK